MKNDSAQNACIKKAGNEPKKRGVQRASQPFVSFILPVYNVEEYIGECLDSILAQSYQNYEVILVNDGSADHSAEKCRQYLSDTRFHYFEQPNSGSAAARNVGIANAKGKWLAFVDPDDKLERNYLERLTEFCAAGADIISCCCAAFCSGEDRSISTFYDENTVFSDRDDCNIVIAADSPQFKRENKDRLLLELMDLRYDGKTRATAIGVPWGKLYRAGFIRENQLQFDVRLRRMQDNIFNMYAFEAANGVVYLNEPLYCYRTEHIKAFGAKFNPGGVENWLLISEHRRKYLAETGRIKDAKMWSAYLKEASGMIARTMKTYFLHPEKKLNRSTLAELDAYLQKDICLEVLRNLDDIRMNSRKAKLTWFLLRRRQYLLLAFLHRKLNIIR